MSGYIEGFAIRNKQTMVLSFDTHTWFEGLLERAGKGEEGFKDTKGCVLPFPLSLSLRRVRIVNTR